MKPADLLFTQGFGSRRECAALVANGCLDVEGVGLVDDFDRELDVANDLWFRVRGGEPWPYRERALIVMNKPAGYECSQKPRHHASVYSLLPAPLRQRGVQAIGRLDEDTTGVLLFTDDGSLVHRLTSPKRHVAKVYEVGCKHAVDAGQVERLRAGDGRARAPADAARRQVPPGEADDRGGRQSGRGARAERVRRGERGGPRGGKMALG